MDHLIICLDERYLSQQDYEALRGDCERAVLLINGYIRFLKKQKDNET